MNILVCNAQVPFTRGGAEMLAAGLCDALSARGHRAEVVALPFKWYPKHEIIKSALAWRLLDLTASNGARVDRLIATKFPSYAATHPYKIVWLVHQFRQAYDWYNTPLSEFADTPEDDRVRAEVMALDRRALGEARARFAISKNVAARLKKFSNLDAQPLYPPPRLTGKLRVGEYGDYVLYLGRLDRAKRVDWLIRALAQIKTGRVVISGDGAESDTLKKLARTVGVASRVEFTGYVDDALVIELYANARAVFYAPIDEDYGFATVEAFMSARPVITTEDAGGVLEFVEHEQDGWVATPHIDALAAALARAFADASICRAWGSAGRERVRDITWEKVVERLIA
jgi:glycosyltransferase involved in cell wall biosynthesis